MARVTPCASKCYQHLRRQDHAHGLSKFIDRIGRKIEDDSLKKGKIEVADGVSQIDGPSQLCSPEDIGQAPGLNARL